MRQHCLMFIYKFSISHNHGSSPSASPMTSSSIPPDAGFAAGHLSQNIFRSHSLRQSLPENQIRRPLSTMSITHLFRRIGQSAWAIGKQSRIVDIIGTVIRDRFATWFGIGLRAMACGHPLCAWRKTYDTAPCVECVMDRWILAFCRH